MKKIYLTVLMGLLMSLSVFASTDVTLTVADYQSTSFADQGVTVTASQGAGVTAPAYNNSYHDLRVYAGGTLTISANQMIEHISFEISAQGKKRLCSMTSNVGTVTVVGDPSFTVDWSGASSSVVITVGAKADYGTDGNSKAGQLAFTALTVTLNGEVIDPVDTTHIDTTGTGPVDPIVTPVYNGDTLSAEGSIVQQALQEYGEETVLIVKGYVTNIREAYSDTYHNVSFNMDNYAPVAPDPRTTMIAYRVYCASEQDAPKVGDLVWVKGKMRTYVSQTYQSVIAETQAGGSFGIIERGPDVLFTQDDFEGGVESSGGEVSYTRNGVTVYTDRGYGSDVNLSLRVYSGALFEITSQKEVMSKIRFTFDEHYDRDYSGGLSRVVIVNSKIWRVEHMQAQARITKIEVYFGGEENQAIDQVTNDPLPMTNKVIKDGQLLILRGNSTYTLTGQKIE